MDMKKEKMTRSDNTPI
uniref:Uncharacterized protein n=1 Tax=Anguilla anguilla TaxID=7936 RepID=A0A0E9RYI5_ANGAN